MEISTESPGHVDAIRSLTTAAFEHAEHSSRTEAAIIDALRRAGALSLSLVAIDDGAIVGHVAFSPVKIDCREGQWFGLGPVSVRPDRQGEGIGSALIGRGLELLRSSGAEGCVVLGEPAYYGRFGFSGGDGLRYPDAPAPYFQWTSFAGAPVSGTVSYHPAFSAG